MSLAGGALLRVLYCLSTIQACVVAVCGLLSDVSPEMGIAGESNINTLSHTSHGPAKHEGFSLRRILSRPLTISWIRYLRASRLAEQSEFCTRLY